LIAQGGRYRSSLTVVSTSLPTEQGMAKLPVLVQRPNKCSTRSPDADGLSWKTTHHFRRMLLTRALAAYASALKNVDMTDPG